jgi:hypothetical protein
LNDSIDNLRAIIQETTNVLQSNMNLSSSDKARMQGINTSAHASLIQLTGLVNDRSTDFGNAYTQALKASKFVNEAKGLLDNMYNDETKKLNDLYTTNSTQLKQIQFNNYFSQKYNYNVGIMKILVATSILLMICIFLHTRDLIPTVLYTILLAVIISIALIIIVTMLISEIQRSNTNFNEFQWADPPKT